MQIPDYPNNEAARLQALSDLQILDTDPEERFDRFTRLAQYILNVPIALISLIDHDRQWFKSRQGLAATQTARSISFCGHAILGSKVLCIIDAAQDGRFADNPLVTGEPKIRFYAGAPLELPGGVRIGTLCAIDREPREPSPDQLEALHILAQCVVRELQLGATPDATRLLRAHDARLTGILDTLNDGVMACEADGTIWYANRGVTRLLGYEADELEGRALPALVAADDRGDVERLLAQDASLGQEEPLRRIAVGCKSGGARPLAIAASRLAGGSPTARLAVLHDPGRQEARMEERARFFSVSLDLLCVASTDGWFKQLNPAFAETLGWTVEELLSHPFLDFVHPDDVLATQAEVSKLAAGGICLHFENRYRCKDGTWRWLSWKAAAQPDGTIYATARDLTAQRAQQERLRAVLATVADGIITIDAQGIIESVNPAAEGIFGYAAAEMIGRNVSFLMPEPYQSAHDRYLQSYLQTREAKVIGIGREVRGLRRDGTVFPLELAVNEMQVGGATMFTGVVRDITERKRIEQLKNEFVSTVSHELRTPLTSVRGALSLVLGKAAADMSPKARDLLQMAARNCDRLAMLINDILDLEKIESGRLDFDFRCIDLVALARQAQAANAPYGAQQGVTIELREAPAEAPVVGDEHRLLQVYSNLLSNAIKYSPQDGVVEIRIERRDDCYRISIRDHGKGIPTEFRERIFQRFAQADSSDTRQKGGTGLGLSISKAIVDRHSGTIGYDTTTGQGTTFFFELPAQARLELPTSDTHTVLICEDNADVAAVLAALLAEQGIGSERTDTASGALRLLQKQQFAGLLLDLGLPDIDGLSLLRMLRHDPATRELPVIVVSGNAALAHQRWTGDGLPVLDWLQKPVDTEQLRAALLHLLHRDPLPTVLHVEDDYDLIQVTQSMLGNRVHYTFATTLATARQALSGRCFDVLLLDLGLPDGSGLDLLGLVQPETQVILFSGEEPSREVAAQVAASLTKGRHSHTQVANTVMQAIQRRVGTAL